MLTIWLNRMVKRKIESSAQDKIVCAARNVFLAKGLAGARMQDIADEAGINKALLHYYFRSKDKLFEMIFRELSQRFIPRINEIFESDLSLFEKIETFCGAYIDKIIENPFMPLFVLNEVNKQPSHFIKKIWGGKKPKIEKLIAQIKMETKKGNIKPVHPLHLIMNMMSLCIFPFVAKPMLQMVAGVSDTQFKLLMEERKKEVPKFIIDSIKK